jgi:tetratricopeptide (TPR) repeat protein
MIRMVKKLYMPVSALFIFFTAFFVYLFTMASTFTSGDSGEFISMAVNLGIPHPSGFPLYLLMGKIFSILPLANPGFRINLMSAFFGAMTPSFVFIALYLFFKKEKNTAIRYFLPAIVSLLFIFSYTLWSQAVISNFHAMNAAFCGFMFLIFILYSEYKQEPSYLFIFSLFGGLGAGFGPAFILFSIILFLQLAVSNFRKIKKEIIWMLFFTAIGLSVYAYIIIRSGSDARLKWFDISSPSTFLGYVFGHPFAIDKISNGINGAVVFLDFLWTSLLRELSPLSIALFAAGIAAAYVKGVKYTTALILAFFLPIIILFFYTNSVELKLASGYMAQSYIIISFFTAYFFYYIFKLTKNSSSAIFAASACALIMFALSFPRNSFEAAKQNNYTAYNYAGDILSCMPESKPGLFADGDNIVYPLSYYKFVINKKPLLSVYNDFPTVFRDSLPLLLKSKSNQTLSNVLAALSLGYTDLYTTDTIGSPVFSEVPCGLLYRISDKYAESVNSYWKLFSMRGITREPIIFHDFEEREIAGTYLYRLAASYKSRAMFSAYEFYLEKAAQTGFDSVPVLGNVALLYSYDPFIKDYFSKAEILFLKCYALDPFNFNLALNIAGFYERFEKMQQAAFYFEKAVKLDPHNLKAKKYLSDALSAYRKQVDEQEIKKELNIHFENGRKLLNEKKLEPAKTEFESDIKLNPKLARSRFYLGLISSMQGDYSSAIPFFEKAIMLEPKNVPALDNLGLIYIQQKNYKKAAEYFEKSLAIDPKQERIKKDLDRLRKMGY